jgi:hypothetical protein
MLSYEISESKGTRSLHVIAGLQRLVNELEGDSSLFELDRFRARVEALNRLEAFDLDSQLPRTDLGEHEAILYRRARALQTELEGANSLLYESIRDGIRHGDSCDALLRWTSESEREAARQDREHAPGDGDSYDYLDELVAGVLQFAPSNAMVELSVEMVAYQPTPARHIFELLRRTKPTESDVLIDLGSGLGHVPLLVAICTKARVVGIELEPSYVECARTCAENLKLSNAAFLIQDAREADLSSGTIFYLYTPFRGTILRTVLDRLRVEAKKREIRVGTFGPCTPIVAVEPWLMCESAEANPVSVFRSKT